MSMHYNINAHAETDVPAEIYVTLTLRTSGFSFPFCCQLDMYEIAELCRATGYVLPK